MAWRDRGGLPSLGPVTRPESSTMMGFDDATRPIDMASPDGTQAVQRFMECEAVVNMDDLLLRRMDCLAAPVPTTGSISPRVFDSHALQQELTKAFALEASRR
jgi:glycerol-3-phosphate dehydrogenase